MSKPAYLHRLKEGDRPPVPVDNPTTKAAIDRANGLIEGLVAGAFRAKPHREVRKLRCTSRMRQCIV